jgi:DNA-binding transcriptional MerR regulator
MHEASSALPAIPAKRYFTIGEVSELCGVKPYVLRYWEQEFTQLRPMKRRGNRRYYQHHEVLLVRRIRSLLYDEGFTISGARNRLGESLRPESDEAEPADADITDAVILGASQPAPRALAMAALEAPAFPELRVRPHLPDNPSRDQLRAELLSIRDLLGT